MQAKYYIYRNLHTKTFSVQYKGKVIAHPENFIAYNCEFKVSESGRQRVITEKRKNVHAKIVCDKWDEVDEISFDEKQQLPYIYYNPYKVSQFQFNNQDILSSECVAGANGCDIFNIQKFKKSYS